MDPSAPSVPAAGQSLPSQVDANKRLIGRSANQEMGKDAFLRLLVEQLKNQNPVDPVNDKDFIAQVAQFNALEQMIELNRGFKEVGDNLGESQALRLLGKEVTVSTGRDREGRELLSTGRVEQVVVGDGTTKVSVAGQSFPLSAIRRIGP